MKMLEMQQFGQLLILTLMKPPSGLARLNGGCVFTRGFSSWTDLIFWNFGTGPRPGCWLPPEIDAERGDLPSCPKGALSWDPADGG